MNIDIDVFALLINEKGAYLAHLYRNSGYLNGVKLPVRNRHGKVKLSDALLFKQILIANGSSHPSLGKDKNKSLI